MSNSHSPHHVTFTHPTPPTPTQNFPLPPLPTSEIQSHHHRRRSIDRSTVASSSSSSSSTSASAASSLSRRRPPSPKQQAPNPIHLRPKPYSKPRRPFYHEIWFLGLLASMGFSCLAFGVFLYLSLLSSPWSSASAAATETIEITYGTVLKLMHEKTRYRLHSHEVPYGSGSGQQSVTGFPEVDDSNSYWIVKPEPGTSAKQGDRIPSGTIIRLQHMKTRRWLHSHLYASPISGNQEVSCFGSDSESDTGDYWRLLIEGSGKTWSKDQKIRLQHVDTGAYLHSHNKKYSRIAGGQQEVCGVQDKRADNVWLAAEGVYLPVDESK